MWRQARLVAFLVTCIIIQGTVAYGAQYTDGPDNDQTSSYGDLWLACGGLGLQANISDPDKTSASASRSLNCIGNVNAVIELDLDLNYTAPGQTTVLWAADTSIGECIGVWNCTVNIPTQSTSAGGFWQFVSYGRFRCNASGCPWVTLQSRGIGWNQTGPWSPAP